jgi:NADH dehydrogenase
VARAPARVPEDRRHSLDCGLTQPSGRFLVTGTDGAARVLVVGGGFVGLYSAMGLEKRCGRAVEVTLVSPESSMVYQPFLPEAAGGNIEPRHVVVPLRSVLTRTRLLVGEVTGIDHERRRAVVAPREGPEYELPYDEVVLALGSVSRTLPVPGLAEHAIGFKSLAEAIYLRNHVLSCMDTAESTTDDRIRRAALTFVFVGGGYAGVEALAELEDLARDASCRYRRVSRADMRWVLIEAAAEILPEMAPGMGWYALETLRGRDIEVLLSTRLESVAGGVVRLSNGESFEAKTLVWTTGVRAHPLVGQTGFPVDERGRVETDEYMRVRGVEGAWAAGDCAAVPDVTSGGIAPPTAQHALREARRLAANLAASLSSEEMRPFRYRNMGGIASLGRYKGIAKVVGIQIKGFPAWWLHRNYHVLMLPTLNRKVRVILDWTVALFFRRDVVQLGTLHHPREAFEQALMTSPPRAPGPPREGGESRYQA